MSVYSKRLVYLSISYLIQVVILFAVIIRNGYAIYGSNDDALIASFSADDALGDDKDNWIFIKSFISIPLTSLQNYMNNYGSYGIFLAFVIILSISSLICLTLLIKSKILHLFVLILVSICLFPFSIFALFNPTYTGAAIFSGAVGFALLFFGISKKYQPNKDLLILSGILISISFLIRFESFLLNFGFFLALAIFTGILIKPSPILSKALIPILIFASVFTANLFIDNKNYSSSEWANFIELNNVRHQIHLRTAEYVLGDYLTEIGWTQSDYEMFRKFSLADEDKLSIESLNTALEVSSFTRGFEAILNANFKNELIFINYSYLSFYWLIFLMLVFLVATILLTTKKLKYIALVSVILILGVGINYIFAVSYHMPDRLTFNILFIVFVGLVMSFLALNDEHVLPKRRTIASGITASIFTILIFTQLVPEQISLRIEQNQKIKEIYSLQKSFLAQDSKNQIYLGTGSRLIYAGQSPYLKFEPIGTDDRILILGWHNLSPIWTRQVENLQLDSKNFHKSVLESNKVAIIENSDASTLLYDFYSQYSKEKIILDDAGFIGTDFYRVYKISNSN